MIEERGDPIPGSRMIREFCILCKQAMRVPYLANKEEKEENRPMCSECTRTIPGYGNSLVYRQRMKLGKYS